MYHKVSKIPLLISFSGAQLQSNTNANYISSLLSSNIKASHSVGFKERPVLF